MGKVSVAVESLILMNNVRYLQLCAGESAEQVIHSVDVTKFSHHLITWGQQNFRPFPWRFTENPYHILVAEVMLHRTQALQVVPVYEQFIRRYPNVTALAQASKAELLTILHSLGLHQRIDLLHTMASQLANHHHGEIPFDKRELLNLAGVSDYIASAVRCFGWNQPEPIIDTNSVRVVSRLFLIEARDSSRRNRHFKTAIATLVDAIEPRTYNYALLDLAAQICVKREHPHCEQCPVSDVCAYGTATLNRRQYNFRNVSVLKFAIVC
jgi:A/G-specific adenine glycosylase